MDNDDADDDPNELVGTSGEIPLEKLKRYIAYARQKCAPRLDEAAAEALQNHYVGVRSTVREREVAGNRCVDLCLFVGTKHRVFVDTLIRLFGVGAVL